MNRNIRLLLFGSYLWHFGAGLLGPLYVVFAEKIGGDILQMTSAYSLYLIVLGSLSIFVGKVSDHVSKKKMMVVGYALNAIATFGYLLVHKPLDLFMVQALFGVAAALATPTWDALFSKSLDSKKEGEEWGFSDGGPSIISGIALLCGGIIISYLSFGVLFICMGTMQVIAAIVQTAILFPKQDKKIK